MNYDNYLLNTQYTVDEESGDEVEKIWLIIIDENTLLYHTRSEKEAEHVFKEAESETVEIGFVWERDFSYYEPQKTIKLATITDSK